jgi:hypothetical protein
VLPPAVVLLAPGLLFHSQYDTSDTETQKRSTCVCV